MSSPIITNSKGIPFRLQSLSAGWSVVNGVVTPAAFSGSLRQVTATQSGNVTTYADVPGAAGLVAFSTPQLKALVAANPALQPLLDNVAQAAAALAEAALLLSAAGGSMK